MAYKQRLSHGYCSDVEVMDGKNVGYVAKPAAAERAAGSSVPPKRASIQVEGGSGGDLRTNPQTFSL
ncbi:hypothetical protein GOP47_0030525 [Adiantum capillus-veneris]|nr:hypothetical protein GOP47_0030525 [Adiantum capillus-veneris]